jgi:acyl dehydratase
LATAQAIELNALRERVGSHLGYSGWREVTQEQVDRFADATGDHQWIHVDPARAAAGPFGRTIAHGYLTLSLGPVLLAEVLTVSGISYAINYGLNRVRFPAPVPVGSRVRLGVELASLEDVAGGASAVFTFTFEVEGQPKPACVAETLYRFVL